MATDGTADPGHDPGQNSVKKPSDTELSNWLTRSGVLERTGWSMSTLKRRENELRRFKLDEVWRYDPDQFDVPPATEEESLAGAAFRSLTGALDSMAKHVEKVNQQILQGAKDALEIFGTLVRDQQKQILDLQAGRFQMLKTVEESLTSQSERDIAKLNAEASAKLKRDALTEFSPALRLIQELMLQNARERFGGKPSDPKPSADTKPATPPAAPNETKPAEKVPNCYRELFVALAPADALRIRSSGAFTDEQASRALRVRELFDGASTEEAEAHATEQAFELLTSLSTEQRAALEGALPSYLRVYWTVVRTLLTEATKETPS